MLVHEADPAELAGIFGIDHADHLVTTTALRTPQVRLAQDGAVVDPTRYTHRATIAGQPMTGLVDTRKALALFDGGATIVFQGLQRYWEPLRQLVGGLERKLGHPCQANAYLTPPGSQGFALHSDTHDVFTFQTYGTKEWEVHDADGVHQVLMKPGTSMYLPTGTPHMARTGEGAASLHVTVGINQVVWADVLKDVVTGAIDADPAQRDRLPAAPFADLDGLAAALSGRLSDLTALLSGMDAAAEVDRLEASFSTGRQPVLAGGLRDLLDLRELGADTPLRRRPGSQCTMKQRDGSLELLLGDRRLTLPGAAHAAVRFVVDADGLRPSDLPGIDPAGALVLCRRLVREGFLEVVR
ncbi:MAG TPA: cupin domain-containing protein [Kineosporiaceae bacterium]|nr:cupin domain-containing protein [Kineosporiaceae bacterium]